MKMMIDEEYLQPCPICGGIPKINTIRISEKDRLLPPKNVVCFGLTFSINRNKLDCRNCTLFKDMPTNLPQDVLIIQTDNIPPKYIGSLASPFSKVINTISPIFGIR